MTYLFFLFPFLWHRSPTQARATSFFKFLDHTQWHITVGRTPLDEWSARRKDLYLATHNTQNRQTSMSPEGFEPTIPSIGRPQTLALDHPVTGTDARLNVRGLINYLLIPMNVRPQAGVCGRLIPGFASSNSTEGMHECPSVLSALCCADSGLCDGLITNSEELYRTCVIVCDLETSSEAV